jgi:hypothetical protein
MAKYQSYQVWLWLTAVIAGSISLATLDAKMVAAATLTYDLVDVELGMGGAATGFFAIDELTGVVLSGEITTTPDNNKPVFAGATYSNLTAQLQEPFFYLSSNAPGPEPFFYRLFLTLNSTVLGNAQIGTDNFTLFEGARFGSPSGFTVGERIAIADTPGTLVLQDNTAAVPEPLTLLGTTLAIGAGVLLRKRTGALTK